MIDVVGAARDHANEIANIARELAETLAEADDSSMPPLTQCLAVVDLERIRADLQRVADGVMMHAAPK
jgi:hypothetical protein